MGPLLVCSGMLSSGVQSQLSTLASMGPLLVCSGMALVRGLVAGGMNPLQWGRCSCAAECEYARENLSDDTQASMGPLLVCSGMPGAMAMHPAFAQLQWGRCSCAAECVPGVSCRDGDESQLQWGRCSCAAECLTAGLRLLQWPLASMGPLLVCSGMPTPDWIDILESKVLQWGRCSCAAEWHHEQQ